MLYQPANWDSYRIQVLNNSLRRIKNIHTKKLYPVISSNEKFIQIIITQDMNCEAQLQNISFRTFHNFHTFDVHSRGLYISQSGEVATIPRFVR